MPDEPIAGPPTLPRGLEAVRTDTGLEYLDVEPGQGKVARDGRSVRAHLRGWLLDGTLFEDTLARETPVEFTVGEGEMIDALDQGLVGMKVGGKRRLIVPSDLAWGSHGNGSTVPPYATLIYDVELIAVS